MGRRPPILLEEFLNEVYHSHMTSQALLDAGRIAQDDYEGMST